MFEMEREIQQVIAQKKREKREKRGRVGERERRGSREGERVCACVRACMSVSVNGCSYI